MLSVARDARPSLGPFSRAVVKYVKGCITADGGCRGRSDESDLYYTVFALDCLLALADQAPPAKMTEFVLAHGDGNDLDLVHLACLARSWTRLSIEPGDDIRSRLLENLQTYRCSSGGYNTRRAVPRGSISGTFLAIQTLEDLGRSESIPDGLADTLKPLRTQDGAYANEPRMQEGSTLATAGAALLLLRNGDPVPDSLVEWLLARVDTNGGFLASPASPLPDLLSTATALLALHEIGTSIEGIRAACLTFIEGLQAESGGFCGHWMDEIPDCEYTFYAILALGCLAK
jgi:hypothetical protein